MSHKPKNIPTEDKALESVLEEDFYDGDFGQQDLGDWDAGIDEDFDDEDVTELTDYDDHGYF